MSWSINLITMIVRVLDEENKNDDEYDDMNLDDDIYYDDGNDDDDNDHDVNDDDGNDDDDNDDDVQRILWNKERHGLSPGLGR